MGKIGQHSSNFIDMTGWKMWEHGISDSRLIIIKQAPIKKRKKAYWICKCSCGNPSYFIVEGTCIRSGNTLSCGCVKKDRHPQSHGQSKGKLYAVWVAMKKRCENANSHDYVRYGGRGICVCDEWKTYEPFYNWAMNNGYLEGLELDRVDNDGNYCPENCRWTTHREQCRNRSTNIWIEYNGKKLSPREWSKITGIPDATIRARLQCGWTSEEAILVPYKMKRKAYYNEKNQ